MDYIHSHMTCPLSKVLRREFEEVDELLCGLMDEAEENCRHMFCGEHPWSPTYKRTELLIDYWLNQKDYALGLNSNVRHLIVLQRQLKLNYDPSLSLEDILRELKATFRQRKHVKAITASLSLEYRTALAEAKEEAGECKAAAYIRSLNQIEHTRRLFRNIRKMEDKFGACSTTNVSIESPGGGITELTDRPAIEEALLANNRRKYH